MPFSTALQMVQRRRPAADPIPAFHDILKTFEAKCIEERDKEGKPTTKRGTSSTEDTGGKAKRQKVGPSIGPSIGSSVGPSKAPIGPSMGPSKPPIGPSIGPQIPNFKESKPDSNKSVIGPAMPPSASIGPTRPPDAKKASIGPAIGPTFPQPKSEGSEKQSYGPSLP